MRLQHDLVLVEEDDQKRPAPAGIVVVEASLDHSCYGYQVLVEEVEDTQTQKASLEIVSGIMAETLAECRSPHAMPLWCKSDSFELQLSRCEATYYIIHICSAL